MHMVIVDDNKMDRYVARRVLSKFDDVETVEEAISGNAFLETYYSAPEGSYESGETICVLMDINMPGLNGFETITEMELRVSQRRGPDCVVVMMLTSSSNPEDKEIASGFKSVKGYSPKPLDVVGVQEIIRTYAQHHKESQLRHAS